MAIDLTHPSVLRTLVYLSSLGRGRKIAIQLFADFSLIVASFLLAMVIRLEHVNFLADFQIWPTVAMALIGSLITLWYSGLYLSLVRFVTGNVLLSISKGALVFALIMIAAIAVNDVRIPRSVPFIAAVLFVLGVGGFRFLVRQSIRQFSYVARKPVAIYGAGEVGLELLNSLFHSTDYMPVAFIDDSSELQGMRVGGYPVQHPDNIPLLQENFGIEVILMAMPTLTYSRRQKIFAQLEGLQLEVKTIPSMSDMVSGKTQVAELRNILPEDLLGRDTVAPDQALMKKNTFGKSVLVTGAGGSIGSELCRQIIKQKPEALFLFELSEFALYSIEAELAELARNYGAPVRIFPILGSVQNANHIDAVLDQVSIDTIYHAAAYKHVPLIEDNVVEGILNNVFGTLNIARAAGRSGVENFLLVSTDKAVRPTNVMGATKRISELICQAFAKECEGTTYSIVRFGNVLGSSGSVIPRFHAQIASGGPVTVTHREVNRYFMTIPEASQLVIQAGAMANGGDVFVLDMGQPVKITDLAETMIRLHGLRPYYSDEANEVEVEVGDIAIQFVGLRKGEKLYEELLIGADPVATQHPRIMTALEGALSQESLFAFLDRLRLACNESDLAGVGTILSELPIDYSPNHTQDR